MKTIPFNIIVIVIMSLNLMYVSCNKNNDDKNRVLGTWNLSIVESTTDNSFVEYPDTLDNLISIILTDSSVVLLDGYCNAGSGKYKVNGNSIGFSDLSMTEMGCLMVEWEDYLYELAYAETYTLEQDQLTIFTVGDVNLLFLKDE